MDRPMHTANTNTPMADDSTSPASGPCEPTMPMPTVAAAAPRNASSERLHYLFRRTGAHHPTQQLKKAVFAYRGVPLP